MYNIDEHFNNHFAVFGYFTANIKLLLSSSTGRAQRQGAHFSIQDTYQEAHKVQREDSGNPSEGQALQHGTADPGWVAVVFGSIAVTVGLTRTGRVHKTPHHHDQMFHLNHCNILMKNLRRRWNIRFILILTTQKSNILELFFLKKKCYIYT